MHLHKFFQYCQLVQAGAKEVPGELVKYLKVTSACQQAFFVFLQTSSKQPDPCPVETHTVAVALGPLHCAISYLCFLTRLSALCVLLPTALHSR